jgi:phage gpG-like protein
MAGVKGDFTKLNRLAANLKGLKESAWRSAAGATMGATALKLVADGFRNSKDPYGKPWKPIGGAGRRKGKKDKPHKILLDTGRLRASFSYRVVPVGFTISSGVVYAAVHQFGHTFSRKARTAAMKRHKSGSFRFMSRKALGKALARSTKRPPRNVKLVTIGAHKQVVNARPMLPRHRLGPIWTKALTAAGQRELKRQAKAGL